MTLQTAVRRVLFGADDNVRSGWRFIFFILVFLFFAIILTAASTAILIAAPVGYSPESIEGYVAQFASLLIATIIAAIICGRATERLSLREFGFGFDLKTVLRFIVGCAVGALTLLIATAAAMIAGGISVGANFEAGRVPILVTLGSSLLIFFFGAAFEEAFFRGYPLQTFARSNLAIFGVALTSLLFATLHNGNPGANPLSWFNTFLAGIWLAVCYFRTGELWFPFGVHLMWNWFQGAIVGINVSGLARLTPAPLFRTTDHGPTWLTGGSYGLEGGVACTLALLISTAAIWFWPRRVTDAATTRVTPESAS